MAFSTRGYAGLIDSMLELRSQRLKEQIAEAEIQQKNQERFASQMQSMGKGLAGMFGQMGENRMANQLMQEEFGQTAAAGGLGGIRGGSTGSAYSAPGVGMAATPRGQFTGGMAELKARTDLAQLRNQTMAANLGPQRLAEDTRQFNVSETRQGEEFGRTHGLKEREFGQRVIDTGAEREIAAQRQADTDWYRQKNLELDIRRTNIGESAEERQKREEIAGQKKDAREAASAMSDKAHTDFLDNKGYITQLADLQNDLAEAQENDDPAAYRRAAVNMQSLYRMAKGRKLEDIGEAPVIAPYMSSELRRHLTTQQRAVANAQKTLVEAEKAPPGWFDAITSRVPGLESSSEAAKAARQTLTREKEALKKLEGMGEPIEAGGTTAAAPGVVAAGGAYAVGQTRTNNRTKVKEEWNGREWIPIQ